MEEGWLNCRLEVDDQSFGWVPSYLSDSIPALLQATTDVLLGREAFPVLFQDEPGEYRLRLWRVPQSNPELVHLRIIAMKDTFSRYGDGARQVVFEAERRLRTFAGQVLASVQKMLAEYGEDGYFRCCHYRFPLKDFQELEQALRQTKKTGKP
ncbi:MAG: hypothetical protein K1Y36_00670 [Blastocatellia bacterium]|nr:hypothetical protein [Blastocatellia bacterium]